ncbi:TIM21 family protein [Candida parapsilosis]|uniref:Mitochondrial import inner membrane translocase subunit Tim21 n=1 Tax=Candida parapsilosis TaxID=5480 RepID=A0A8X7TCJ6_CANPA|nr:TIM21 family protein [Candida parapsilosis]KAF6049457.1 TIM21 family protein [Candida parapsilosis]KAF6057308.1 TIM21 family protein [Candida parapsilosis]KAF6065973.1 TIM21 family protein [Candida parapsilosis]
MNALKQNSLLLKSVKFGRIPAARLVLPVRVLSRFYLTSSPASHSLLFQNFPDRKSSILRYSTKTAPPPQPPHDKDFKGKRILNRITRAFTFSLSSVIVLGAAAIALLVIYLILSELLLPSGDTRTFNKAVKLVEQNEQAQKALQFSAGERLKAYGIVAADKWVRNRPVQSSKAKGKDGKDHLVMKFQVESDTGGIGVVTLEQVDNSWWNTKFEYMALDVRGYRRIYIIEPERPEIARLGKGSGFLGLNWGPKKD